MGEGRSFSLARVRAEESIAEHFTRVMMATPSRWGVLCDVALGATCSAVIIVIGLVIARLVEHSGPVLSMTVAVAAIPLAITIAAPIALRGSRGAVVDWLAGLPFPVENLNSLLAGLGDRIEVTFADSVTALPLRAELQASLDTVSEAIVVLRCDIEDHLLAIQLGVPDSRRNPFGANHARWERLVVVVERILIPLSKRLPIERLLVA
jgi:hypothetical protein